MGEQKTVLLVDELREIRFRQTEISAYQERIQRLKAQTTNATSTPTIGSRGTAGHDRMAQNVAAIEELEAICAAKMLTCEVMIRGIKDDIDKLPVNYREVIRLSDLEGHTWRDVAESMGYTERWCQTLKQYAYERIRNITKKNRGKIVRFSEII